jgi:drug/metabolite transporter (DMT)-like permease
MNWLTASFITLALWSGYSIFADKATSVHGEKVSFLFEVVGMILVALCVFGFWGGLENVRKVTSTSFIHALIMGIMTSGAAFFLLWALRLAPTQNEVPIIVLIGGFYPIITVVLSYFFLGSRLSLTQWLGVGLAGVALALVHWGK